MGLILKYIQNVFLWFMNNLKWNKSISNNFCFCTSRLHTIIQVSLWICWEIFYFFLSFKKNGGLALKILDKLLHYLKNNKQNFHRQQLWGTLIYEYRFTAYCMLMVLPYVSKMLIYCFLISVPSHCKFLHHWTQLKSCSNLPKKQIIFWQLWRYSRTVYDCRSDGMVFSHTGWMNCRGVVSQIFF